MPVKISKNLKQRLAVSILGIAVLIVVIYFSPYGLFKLLFALLMAGVIGMALWEYYHIAKANGYQPQAGIGILFTFLYIFGLYANSLWPYHHAVPEVILGLMLVAGFTYYFIRGSDPFVNLAITAFGVFYLTIPLGCFFDINYFFPPESEQDGRWWLFYVLAVTKMTDTGAYFIGKSYGKTQLAPYISPKKTYEGAFGGLVSGIMTSFCIYAAAHIFYSQPPLGMTLLQSLWLGVLMSLLAQFGDLAESLLKRDMGVKDSNQLPGLGGFLDIVDSLVFTAPLIYIFLKVHYG